MDRTRGIHFLSNNCLVRNAMFDLIMLVFDHLEGRV